MGRLTLDCRIGALRRSDRLGTGGSPDSAAVSPSRCSFRTTAACQPVCSNRRNTQPPACLRSQTSTCSGSDTGPISPALSPSRIVAKPISAAQRSRFVVGIAPETREARAIIAYAFYDRVQLYSAELGLDASQMLGHVMAHELGHLLLPHGAHSLAGVMRGAWDGTQAKQATLGRLTFTSAEAALIRDRLSACASRMPRE